jgi:hypothetical protein
MEMVMRSAILEDNFRDLTRIWEIYGTYIMYKEAEDFLLFVESNYGRSAVPRLSAHGG